MHCKQCSSSSSSSTSSKSARFGYETLRLLRHRSEQLTADRMLMPEKALLPAACGTARCEHGLYCSTGRVSAPCWQGLVCLGHTRQQLVRGPSYGGQMLVSTNNTACYSLADVQCALRTGHDCCMPIANPTELRTICTTSWMKPPESARALITLMARLPGGLQATCIHSSITASPSASTAFAQQTQVAWVPTRMM